MRSFLCATALAAPLIMAGICAESASAKGERIAEARGRVVAMNLLNALDLKADQMRQILEAARRAKLIRGEAEAQIASREEEAVETYNDVLRVSQRGAVPVPRSIGRRVHSLHEERDRIKTETREKLEPLSLRVKNVLEPHQLVALETFKPCIIPPVEKGHIGQADGSSAFGRMLQKMRNMPEEVYQRRRERMLDRVIRKAKARGRPGADVDEEELRRRVSKIMETARAMSDIEFVGKKEEIDRQMKNALHAGPAKPPMTAEAKIERFLLQPCVIPLLEKKLGAR